MSDISITVNGMDALSKRIAKLENIEPELKKAMSKAVLYVHSTVPAYPAAPATSKYRRTETLGRLITTDVRTMGSQVVGVIGTDTVYAPWVISSEKVGGRGPQAWMHVGRWWTLQKVVMDAREKVIGIFEDMIRQLVGG